MRSKKIIYLILLIVTLTGCKEKTFTVTFNTLGGSVINSITVNEGDTIENTLEPVKDGYLFVNWLKDGIEYKNTNPITEDITLTANWIEKPKIYDYYTVTFLMEEKKETITIKENELVKEWKVPEIDNYTFIGWYVGDEKFDFNNKITKDIILVAKYKPNTVTITYDLDGGFGLSIETIPRNTTIMIPENPTKLGHKFLKWTLNGEEFSFDTKITKDITLKAVWELIEYVTVTFDTDGGNTIKQKKVEKYSRLRTLPIPNKEGYKFINWSLGDEIFLLETIIEQDITLKAIYEPILNLSESEE